MRAALPLALAALLGTAAAPAAAEVTLRRHAVVHGGAVLLGDLFENAGPEADRRLGPAPAPGQRWMLEAPQLSLIARDHGLAWKPLSAEDRMVVERPGRPLAREAVAEALMAELALLGAPEGLEPELTGFATPYLPEDAPEPRLMVEAARLDAAARRFQAALIVVAEGMSPIRMPLSGRLVATRPALVATRALATDSILGPGDVAVRRVALDRIPAGAAQDAGLLLGGRLRRAIPADRPLTQADVAPAVALRKDAPVLLVHEAPGLSLTAQARALEDAAAGAVTSVLNLATGTVVFAEVTGPGRARALGGGQAPAPRGGNGGGGALRAADARR